jgi:hypothetical protein
MIILGQFGFNCPSGFRGEAFSIWGKYRNIFFSEAIALIEPKLCINHWKVLYKLCVYDKLRPSVIG